MNLILQHLGEVFEEARTSSPEEIEKFSQETAGAFADYIVEVMSAFPAIEPTDTVKSTTSMKFYPLSDNVHDFLRVAAERGARHFGAGPQTTVTVEVTNPKGELAEQDGAPWMIRVTFEPSAE